MVENDLSTCGQSVQILFIDFVLYDGIRILSLYRSCYINFEYIKSCASAVSNQADAQLFIFNRSYSLKKQCIMNVLQFLPYTD